jgi:prepilin-type N-terminal cleavage/methylation domain-containing protein
MRTSGGTSAQFGFTLLEFLVALMILTLVFTIALGAVQVSHGSFQTGLTRADHTAEIRTLGNVLRRQFLQLLPVIWNENGTDFIAFDGHQRQLRFVGPAPEGSPGAGYFVYQLGVVSLPGGSRVILAFAPFDPGSNRFATTEISGRELLAESLSDVSFDYFGAQDERDQPSWHSIWPSHTGRFPTIVRIRLVSSTLQWPDMVFQTHFEVEG